MTLFSKSWGLAALLVLTSTPLVGCGKSERQVPGPSDAGEGGEGGSSGKGGSTGLSGSGGSAGSVAGSGGDTSGTGGDTSGTGGTDIPSAGAAGAPEPDPDTGLTQVRRQRDRRVDLLFMIDGSLAMGEKQALLAESIPLLVRELTSLGLVDLHLGIVTSSLGHHGSHDVCSEATEGRNPDDKAQLLPSVRSGAGGNDSGFLAWEPGDDSASVVADFQLQLSLVGEYGCGYEGSLEAWYRFLVDPEPVGTVDNDMTNTVRVDTNNVVLEQRAAFLRPDSVVGIVMLTDENDCSILDENQKQGWLVPFKGGVAVNNWRMPASTASCKTDPNSPCCRPCIIGPAPGCGDNVAEGCTATGYLPIAEDSMNQRCFQQQQRFGIDLLYPTSRYVEALTSPSIEPRMDGFFVPNPLFSGNFPAQLRSPRDVALIGILGVPWQDVATAESLSDDRTLRFLTAAELTAENRWDVILGAPGRNFPPIDPLMIESIDPRPSGTPHPFVPGAAIVAPGQTDTNTINGREMNADPNTRDDLQYACIFPLREPVPCGVENAALCDCNAEEYLKDSPLCEYPGEMADGTQLFGKAYPSLRQLEVLKGVGTQGLVTSICPKNVETDSEDPSDDLDYGYNPAVLGIVDLVEKSAGYDCLAEPLRTEEGDGGHQLACPLVAIMNDCACGAEQGLSSLAAPLESTIRSALAAQRYCDEPCENVCLCEVSELSGDALAACQSDTGALGDEPGFCFLDDSTPGVNTALLDQCPEGSKRSVRFSGPANDAVTAYLIACSAAL